MPYFRSFGSALCSTLLLAACLEWNKTNTPCDVHDDFVPGITNVHFIEEGHFGRAIILGYYNDGWIYNGGSIFINIQSTGGCASNRTFNVLMHEIGHHYLLHHNNYTDTVMGYRVVLPRTEDDYKVEVRAFEIASVLLMSKI